MSGNAPQEKGGSCPVGSGATPYVAGTNRLAGVSYDGVGNQTSIFQGDTTVYDAEGRVTAVMNGATTVAAYQYDADGRRVQKTTAGGTTNYVYDDSGALLAEYAGAALTKEYVRFHSEYIPSNVDLVAVENATASGIGCTTCFVIPDYLGNVRMVADNAGNASSRHDYLPFGEEAVADGYRLSSGGFGGADGLTQRFTGKERDPEEGLDYFGARYYGSVLGRFTGADDGRDQYARDPQSWNLYAYVRNNPLANIDLDGHDEYTFDQSGRQTGHKRQSFLHNLLFADTFTMNLTSGGTIPLYGPVAQLPADQQYTVVSAAETAQAASDFVNKNAEAAASMTLGQFKDASKNRSAFDFKRQLDASSLYIWADGRAYDSDGIGNITWGFLSTVAVGGSISNGVAHLGAAYAQVFIDKTSTPGWIFSHTLGDRPQDFDAINVGRRWAGEDLDSAVASAIQTGLGNGTIF